MGTPTASLFKDSTPEGLLEFHLSFGGMTCSPDMRLERNRAKLTLGQVKAATWMGDVLVTYSQTGGCYLSPSGGVKAYSLASLKAC